MKKGMVLFSTIVMMTTLTTITIAFLYMNSVQLKASGYDGANQKAFALAEAGLQKAIWNLMTPVGSGGQGENWTTPGTSESLGSGTYRMVVARWDFALFSTGSLASASSSNGVRVPLNAIDGNNNSYWQSQNKPTPANPQEIIVHFPYTLKINKVRFFVPNGSAQQGPKDYSWQVSTDGVSYVTVATGNNNASTDVIDTFTAAVNVNYLKLRVTDIGGGATGVRIATLEAIGSKITSSGTSDVMNRRIEQTVVVDDATRTAFDEQDWTEIFPAN